MGLDRYQIFVTNAVLCNPKDVTGNNAPPLPSEIKNCSNFLRRQISLLDPKIVVSLGNKALDATKLIEAHDLNLKRDVRTKHKWCGRLLLPIYHPGQRALAHRSFANQLADYQFVVKVARTLDGLRRKTKSTDSLRLDVQSVATEIFAQKSTLSYFALHKLFYLIECHAVRKLGKRLTNAFFLRQINGPYCTDLHYSKLKAAIPNLEIFTARGEMMMSIRNETLFAADSFIQAPNEVGLVVSEVIRQFGDCDDKALKAKAYLTGPMRWMLKAEIGGANMFNAPIDFSKSAHSPI